MIRTEQMDGGIWYWDKAGFILITVEVQLIEPKIGETPRWRGKWLNQQSLLQGQGYQDRG